MSEVGIERNSAEARVGAMLDRAQELVAESQCALDLGDKTSASSLADDATAVVRDARQLLDQIKSGAAA